MVTLELKDPKNNLWAFFRDGYAYCGQCHNVLFEHVDGEQPSVMETLDAERTHIKNHHGRNKLLQAFDQWGPDDFTLTEA